LPEVIGLRLASPEILAIKEALLWERDVDARRGLLVREDMLLDQINDQLSLEIVAKRQDRHNRLVEPWVYQHRKIGRVAFPRLERV
jgi:hypothetical protein